MTNQSTEPPVGWTFIEGLYYWDDENHHGNIWITQEMVDKHELHDIVEPIEEDDDRARTRNAHT